MVSDCPLSKSETSAWLPLVLGFITHSMLAAPPWLPSILPQRLLCLPGIALYMVLHIANSASDPDLSYHRGEETFLTPDLS